MTGKWRRLYTSGMELKTYLESHPGSSVELAKFLGISKSQVSQWKRLPVPCKYMKAIRMFTGGWVGLDDLVPEPVIPHGGFPKLVHGQSTGRTGA